MGDCYRPSPRPPALFASEFRSTSQRALVGSMTEFSKRVRPRFPLKGSLKGDIDVGIDIDADIDIDLNAQRVQVPHY